MIRMSNDPRHVRKLSKEKWCFNLLLTSLPNFRSNTIDPNLTTSVEDKK
jgi:hypothetical protein